MVHIHPFVGEYAVLFDDQKRFLMVYMINDKRMENGWHFPGGRLEETDTSVEALQREIKEEVGLDAEIIKPLHTALFDTGKHTKYGAFYLAKTSNTDVILEEDQSTADFKWFTEDDIENIEYWFPFYKEVIKKAYKEL